jgi:hypothetical protein
MSSSFPLYIGILEIAPSCKQQADQRNETIVQVVLTRYTRAMK